MLNRASLPGLNQAAYFCKKAHYLKMKQQINLKHMISQGLEGGSLQEHVERREEEGSRENGTRDPQRVPLGLGARFCNRALSFKPF